MSKTKEEFKGEIFNQLKPIISDQLNVPIEDVTLDKTLRDLDADSLDSVETIMEVEKNFDIAIPDADMEKFTNIQSIVDYIADHKPLPEESPAATQG